MCVYVSTSPRPNPSPIPPEPAISSPAYFDQPYTFRPTQSQPPILPAPISPTQPHAYQYTFNTEHSQSLEPPDPLEPQEGNASSTSSITTSQQIHHPSNATVRHPPTGTALVRNAFFVNDAQAQLQLQRSIHSLSRDFRLRGHPYTIESILLPLIYHSDALKYAIIANFILQAELTKPVASSSFPTQNQNQNLARLDVVYYRNAQTHFKNDIY